MERLQKFNEYFENPRKIKIKEIVQLFYDLGFHYAWGYYISDNNKQHRMTIRKTGKRFVIERTKKGNYWIDKDRIVISRDNVDLDGLKSKIVDYFNLEEN